VLPRELRDQIYDLISQPKEETHGRYHFKTLTVVPKARLLNRQFKKEYDERPPLNTHLEVTQCYLHDWHCWHRRQLQGPIPSLPAQTKSLYFNFFACADAPWTFHSPTTWHVCLQTHSTEQIVRDLQTSYGHLVHGLISVMPVLEKVSINISCGNMSRAVALQSATELWAGIPHLSQIALLSPAFDYDLSYSMWCCYHEGK
jgi:hypothetical protein